MKLMEINHYHVLAYVPELTLQYLELSTFEL